MDRLGRVMGLDWALSNKVGLPRGVGHREKIRGYIIISLLNFICPMLDFTIFFWFSSELI